MVKNKVRKTKEVGFIPKDRGKNDFHRPNQESISARDRILIVCEDGKHTPAYLEKVRLNLGLGTIDVVIHGKECGNAPETVLAHALQTLEDDIKKNGVDEAYDRIYCVIDRDGHAGFENVLQSIRENPNPHEKKLIAIPSYPCFEVWILFHFSDSSSSLRNGDAVIKKIKEHIRDYKKENAADFYELYLKEKMAYAIKTSKKILKDHETTGSDKNPSTLIHILIEDLIKESNKA